MNSLGGKVPQTVLPGFRRHLGPEERSRSGWTDGKGNPVKVAPPKGPTFMGMIVPVPRSKRGEELRMGPYRVLQRTDGRYVVLDDRRPLGRGSCYLAGRARPGLLEALRAMAALARPEGFKVTDRWPPE